MKAFITGVTGQDGYYLSKLLLQKGYEVHGTVRRNSSINTSRIDPLISEYSEEKKFNLHYSDLTDSTSLTSLINKIEPQEIYNLAAVSSVGSSFEKPNNTLEVNCRGLLNILEIVKQFNKK